MKTKNLFAISLMSMALFACSNDEVIPDGPDNGNTAIENGVPVTLKLKMPNMQTKATTTEQGSAEEYNVKDVVIVLKYTDNTKFVYTKTLAAGDLTGDTQNNNDKYDATIQNITFKAPAGNAQIYVYANALQRNGQNSPITATTEQTAGSWNTWADNALSSVFTSSQSVSDFWKIGDDDNGEFFMSNATLPQSSMIQETEDANTNKFEIEIQRAAVKVSVGIKEGEDGQAPTITEGDGSTTKTTIEIAGEAGGTLTAFKYRLTSTAKAFSLLPVTWTGAGITYENTDKLTSWTATNSEDIVDYIDKFTAPGTDADAAALQSAKYSPYVYCAENQTATAANLTRVNFQASFIPGAVFTLKTKEETETEWQIAETDRTNLKAPEDADGKAITTPGDFYVLHTGNDNIENAWNGGYIMASEFNTDETNGNTVILKHDDETDSYKDQEGNWNTNKIYLVQTDEDSPVYEVHNLKGIERVTLYKGGLCYFNNIQITPNDGKITRNQWLHLNINKIALPGSPSEGTGGGGGEGGIDFTLKVLEWNLDEYNVSLGDNTTN